LLLLRVAVGDQFKDLRGEFSTERLKGNVIERPPDVEAFHTFHQTAAMELVVRLTRALHFILKIEELPML
jgi:hypothetical protein